MLENPTPDRLSTPQERIRWHRIKNHLKQDDVATCIGVSRTTYMKIDQGQDIILSPAQYDKLSLLFGVPAIELLDEYNKFLYEGQGMHMKAYRKKHRLTQCALAEMFSIQVQRVKRWEQDKNRMSKKWWEKIFGMVDSPQSN